MWEHLRKSRQGHWQAQAYASLPRPEIKPRQAFQRLMAGDVESVPVTGWPTGSSRSASFPIRPASRS